MPVPGQWDVDSPIGMRTYVPTRKGARVANMFETSVALGSPRKIVAQDRVGPLRVSSVFLCIDHSMCLGDSRPDPVLWETMIFHSDSTTTLDEEDLRGMGYGPTEVSYLGGKQWRYASRKEAVEHHAKLVEMLRSGLN